jgi:hypothetical protein
MNQHEYGRSILVAHGFLTRSFAGEESIALLLRREKAVSVMQRVVLLECVVAPRYLSWLAQQNAAGANIYVAANLLRSGPRKRTKEEAGKAVDSGLPERENKASLPQIHWQEPQRCCAPGEI